jgi:uncharacterized protein (DUF362 family)
MVVLLSNGRRNQADAVRRILDTFAAGMDFTRGVFLKPNIVFPVGPDSGEITPPSLVKAVVAALRERDSHIDIVIGEGVAAGCDPRENFRASGYAALANELNVPLIDLHAAERTQLPWKFGRLDLPCVALERTYINLPILKPSSACIISAALKNQKGLVTPTAKKQFHRQGLHEQVAELNATIRPCLTIMDCSHFFGRNFLMAGNNCGEIDATACRLLGIEEPEHVRLARNAGVFAEGYSVEGDRAAMQRGSARPKMKEFRRLGRMRLWANSSACTMCRSLFHDVERDLLKGHNLPAAVKLACQAISGAEIIMGANPAWRRNYRTVICIGECTRRVAREGGFIHIPGCPPRPEDFYNNLP